MIVAGGPGIYGDWWGEGMESEPTALGAPTRGAAWTAGAYWIHTWKGAGHRWRHHVTFLQLFSQVFDSYYAACADEICFDCVREVCTSYLIFFAGKYVRRIARVG